MAMYTWSCVTDKIQEGYQWKEDELLFTLYATCKLIDFRTMGLKTGLLFFYALYIRVSERT